MKITVHTNETVALFQIQSDEFRSPVGEPKLNPAGPTVEFSVAAGETAVYLSLAPKAIERASETSRLNQAISLGYMPAKFTTVAS